MSNICGISMRHVRIADGFWTPRQKLMTDVTIPYMEKILRDEVPGAEKSHALKNFAMAAGEESGEFYGMVFQDSDVAKWLEAAAYSLTLKPDPKLENRVDAVVSLIGRAQQPDGYLNTYFTVKEPENRWKNFLECHELYCAGHMMEAAVALYENLGKDALLKIVIRMADYMLECFGAGKKEAISGHQEVEIGLMRLYHATKEEKYLQLALRFLDLRGQQPDWFEKHTQPHPGISYGGYDIDPRDNRYNQSDLPVREQKKARGHAVRLAYMLTAMADAAATTGDTALQAACERLFDSITQRQMYLTGAIGASPHQEIFTEDYHLPSDQCYGETCAAVAMVFFAHNMLGLTPDGRYADILELELFNGALVSMAQDGQHFFYVNPLEVDPEISGTVPGYTHVLVQRPRWHTCACCPPNLTRLLSSLGGYLWSEDENTLYSHLFIGNEVNTRHGKWRLETEYPWNGKAVYCVESCESAPFRLAIHIPGHVQRVRILVNGKESLPLLKQGYAYLERTWKPDDRVEVLFGLLPRRIRANPLVRDAAGKVALARGPFIYCFESADNGEGLSCLQLPCRAELRSLPYDERLLGGVMAIEADGLRQIPTSALYTEEAFAKENVTLKAIPYFAWSNRGTGGMNVWIRE